MREAAQRLPTMHHAALITATSVIRVLAVSALVWRLAIAYLPTRHQPFGDDTTEAAVRALNAGHPFYLLYEDPGSSRPNLRRMDEGVTDQGVAILMTGLTIVRQAVTGNRLPVTSSLGRDVLMVLLVAAAVAIVAPGVPLLVGLAGILAFYILVTSGPIGRSSLQHWGPAFASLIVAVYLGTVLRAWTILRIASLLLLAGLAAITQILRQDAAVVGHVTGVALLLGGVVGLSAYARDPAVAGNAGWPRVLVRAVAGGVLLIVATASVRPLERWFIGRAMGIPFAETAPVEHGSGWPLYLSLGYVSNPFNIAWRDPIGNIHAGLIANGPVVGNAAVQHILLHEYASIVVTRPWLMVDNIIAKATRIHGLATRRAEPLPDVAVWQQPIHVYLYRALPWLLLLLIGVVWWRPTLEAVFVLVASVALAAAASAGALVVFPDYIGGLQGAIVVSAVILPAAIGSTLLESKPAVPIARRILIWLAVLAIGTMIVASVFTAVQRLRYLALQNVVSAADPFETIEKHQFRYAHVFNDLPVARQGRLVARLAASADGRVARIIDLQRGDLDLFRPLVIVRSATQLHLIAWMGNTFRPPTVPFYQGRTDSLVFICGDCRPESTVNDFPFDSGWTFVSDLEWRGRYRMFSVPLNTKLAASHFFHVDAERVVALDPSIQSTGLRSTVISGVRLSY
jgi:hypothetical protein